MATALDCLILTVVPTGRADTSEPPAPPESQNAKGDCPAAGDGWLPVGSGEGQPQKRNRNIPKEDIFSFSLYLFVHRKLEIFNRCYVIAPDSAHELRALRPSSLPRVTAGCKFVLTCLFRLARPILLLRWVSVQEATAQTRDEDFHFPDRL